MRKVAKDGECFSLRKEASSLETADTVVPIRLATSACVSPAVWRASSMACSAVYSSSSASNASCAPGLASSALRNARHAARVCSRFQPCCTSFGCTWDGFMCLKPGFRQYLYGLLAMKIEATVWLCIRAWLQPLQPNAFWSPTALWHRALSRQTLQPFGALARPTVPRPCLKPSATRLDRWVEFLKFLPFWSVKDRQLIA